MTINVLKGAKGGGGGSAPQPTSTPDNLRSKDSVEAILAISEGPIFGLKDGAKSFYIGDTALQNASGDYNFKTFVLNFFPGSDVADPIVPVLGGQSSNSSVNLTLAKDIAVTRTTTTRGINSIDVRLAFNRLMISNTSGTFAADASFRIEYKKVSDVSWTTLYGQDITINGKTTSQYVKEFRIILEADADDDWDIRVTKLSNENTDEYFCDMSWESYQETLADSRAYDNTAVIQISGEASDQFSSIPQWSGIYRGLMIQIPSNYDPITREYDGAWDGSWQIAWTNNPAWCLYDFVMNERYGIRYYYPDIVLDKYDVYEAAQWCDELVPDGQGGFQPRYTFNAIITEPRPGKELARYIAGTFNSTFFDDLNGTAYLKVDKDDTAVAIFSKENVFEEGFEYSYTDITTRFNDITVTFLNPDLNWAEDRRRIFDQTLIDRNGNIPLDFIAVGCTNAREALRRAWYKLITANTENCLVSFRTNRYGGMIKPFDVILVSDSDMGYGISGRIKSLNEARTIITLRNPVYLELGVTYYINLRLNDSTNYRVPLVNTQVGYNTTLEVDTAIPENLADKAQFAIEAQGVIGTPRPFRVTKVEEQDGSPDGFLIEAININRNKWYDSDNIVDSGVIDYSTLPNPFDPPGPTNVQFTERFIKLTKNFQIIVSPTFDRGAYKYYANDHSFEVWSRLNGTNDVFVKREVLYGDTLIDHPPGLYDFKILGKSSIGKTTRLETAGTYVFNVTNPKDAPANIDWIKINKREVYWGYANPPDDFAGFQVRYHNEAGRTTWSNAIRAHQGLISATSFYTQLIPPSARVIMVRAVDVYGIPSEESAIIYRDLGDISITNEVDRIDFAPTFTGTKTNCSVISGELMADDTGTNVYSGDPNAEMYDGGDMYEAVYAEMTYEADFTITSGGETLIDIEFSGSGYEVLYREDGTTDWLPLPERQDIEPGDYNILLRLFGGHARGIVTTFSIIVDAQDVIEDLEDLIISSGSAGLRIPITKNYSTIKIVSVIIQDDGSSTAVGYRVFDKDTTIGAGPLVKLVDATGAFTTGTFDAQIKGFI
jgi:hypothetical protein